MDFFNVHLYFNNKKCIFLLKFSTIREIKIFSKLERKESYESQKLLQTFGLFFFSVTGVYGIFCKKLKLKKNLNQPN